MAPSETIVSVIGCAGGASARGASHAARQTPNQDAVEWQQQRLWTYLAVADGHGSAPHYRSDRGSRFAVETAIAVMRDATDGGALREPDALASRIAKLAPKLVVDWQARVQSDIDRDPVAEAPGSPSYQVYGSTCVGAAVGPGMTLLMQIGDGDIFVGTSSGVIETPIPPDDTQGEQTYSLCLPDATDHVKIKLFCAPSPLSAPDFILAATDGFSKSFDDDSAVTQVVKQCRQASHDRGLKPIVAELGPWLAKCSQMGSGDDTSVAIFSVDKATHAIPAASPADRPATSIGMSRRAQIVLVLISLLVGGLAGATAVGWAEWNLLGFLLGAGPRAVPPAMPQNPIPSEPRTPNPPAPIRPTPR